MFITDWPMSLKQRLPGSDESRRGKVERSGVKDVVVHLKRTLELQGIVGRSTSIGKGAG